MQHTFEVFQSFIVTERQRLALKKSEERPGDLNPEDIRILHGADPTVARAAIARWRAAHNIDAPLERRSYPSTEDECLD